MSEQERKRGGCLTAYLIVALIVNAMLALYYVLLVVQRPSWQSLLVTVLPIVNILLFREIWRWKKAGFYGFLAMPVVSFLVFLIMGLPYTQAGIALVGYVGVVILAALLNRVWSQLE